MRNPDPKTKHVNDKEAFEEFRDIFADNSKNAGIDKLTYEKALTLNLADLRT